MNIRSRLDRLERGRDAQGSGASVRVPAKMMREEWAARAASFLMSEPGSERSKRIREILDGARKRLEGDEDPKST